MSDRVAAHTRAANVDAFMVWSACSTRQVSRICASRARRRRAAQLEQEVRGQAEARDRRAGSPGPRARGVVGGDQDRLLGGEPGRLARGSPPGALEPRPGRRRWPARPGCAAPPSAPALAATSGRLAVTSLPRLARRPPARRGSRPAPPRLGRRAALQQVGDLLEGRGPGQLVDVVAAVEQAAGLAVDVAERGGRGDHVGQALGRLVRHLSSSRTARSAVYFRSRCAHLPGRLPDRRPACAPAGCNLLRQGAVQQPPRRVTEQ